MLSPSSACSTSKPPVATAATLPWYGIRTKSNCEKVASAVLESKGYEQYLPLYRGRKRRWDRVVETEQPLFPGYVFCRFDAKQRLPIITTSGVVSIVGVGCEPAPIADHEIEAIHAILDSGLSAEPCPFLREGQHIRINRGALENVEGVLLKKKSEWRMVVSVTMLQRSISVEIDRDWISKV